MASIATVATRPRARWPAQMPAAMSICERTQPPNMSPLGFASAGIARVRVIKSPLGRFASFCIHNPVIGNELQSQRCLLDKLSISFPRKTVTPHFVVKGLLGYAETLADGDNVAMMPTQGLNDQTSLEIADDVLQRPV